MRKIWMPIVAIILSAAVLLGLNNGLNGIRVANQEAELQKKMQELLPGSTTFTAENYAGEDANIQFVYRGETGFVVGASSYGYAGNIDMLIGVSTDGAVTGLQVRDMQETYGLGAEALHDVEFLSQFLYTTGDVVIASNDASQTEGTEVDALSGATVTSKAIVRCVNSAVAYVTGADVSSAATSWGG